MKKNAKKNMILIVIIAALLAVIFVILKYVGVPIPIKKEVIASQIVIGEDSITPVEVEIDGWLRIFVGGVNRFEGEFEIEGQNQTQETEITMFGVDDVYTAKYDKAEQFDLLVSDSLFWRNFAFQITDGVIFADGKTVILYPEVTADTLEERITEIRREVGWSEQLLLEEETKSE